MNKENCIKNLDFHNGVAVVRLTGTVTLSNLRAVQEEFRSKTREKEIKNILFDLKDISNTDTSGIAALVDLLKYMKTHHTGQKVGLINTNARIKDLISILKAEVLFKIFDSEEDAITNLQ